MVFCNDENDKVKTEYNAVTILILIDGFLQFKQDGYIDGLFKSHNPYFNRWFSAMSIIRSQKAIFGWSQSLF